MSADDLQLKPHNINKHWWWYEEREGICVVNNSGDGAQSSVITISWRAIRAALKRLDKRKTPSPIPLAKNSQNSSRW